MKPGELLKELAFPLTDLTVVMAIVGFGLFEWLAAAAGLLGLWLAFIVVPATFRYAIYLLEARAHGKETLVAGVEIFNIADNLWGIFPLLLLILMAWTGVVVATNVGWQEAQILLAVFFLVYPASMAVLGITRSPLASVNPVMLWRMIRSCGVDYAWIPVLLTAMTLIANFLYRDLLPGFSIYFLGTYLFFLLFTLTGAVVHANGVVAEVDIDAPLPPTAKALAGNLEKARQKVASHAYGFISRGNREGGFRHIREWIQQESDADEAVRWFFNAMMKWDSSNAALFFGQECFAHFLRHENDAQALKTLSACLHLDPRWRPRTEDRSHAVDLAKRHGRDDLIRLLGS